MRERAASRSPRPTRATNSASGSSIMLRQSAIRAPGDDRMRRWGPPALTCQSFASGGEAVADSPEEHGALRDACRLNSLEVFRKADIGKESRRVLMEMQERLSLPVKHAARFLVQLVQRAKLAKQRLEL